MLRPKIWQARSVPVKLVSRIFDQSSSEHSSVGTRSVIPAEFTRISTRPNFRRASLCKASIEARSRTSATHRSDRRPRISISLAIRSTSPARRETAITSAPAEARPRAIDLPSPEVPPMTTAHLPVKSKRPLRNRTLQVQLKLQLNTPRYKLNHNLKEPDFST